MSKYVNNQMDINAVMSKEYGISISGRYKTHCPNPEHRDSDASFEVYGENRGGYCFGCGKAYWPIDLIMFKREITYYEALQVAESEYGAELPTAESGLKEETKADVIKYNKLKGLPISNKKQMHNYCLALSAIADENDELFSKYCKMKGISND